MRVGRYFWNLMIGHALLIAAVLIACLWSLGPTDTTARMELLWRILPMVLAGYVALGFGLWVTWSKPIARITAAARALSRGNLDTHLSVDGHDEIGLLARSLNRMRDRLAAQLSTIDQQRQTLEAMLVHLHEGIVVTDADGRILLINPAAVRMMGLTSHDYESTQHPPVVTGTVPVRVRSVPTQTWIGRTVEECVPQHDLQKLLLRSTLNSDNAANGEPFPAIMEERVRIDHETDAVWLLARASDIALPVGAGRIGVLSGKRADRGGSNGATGHVHGIFDSIVSGGTTGRLLVLTDITDMTHAMQVKTDFVANASHELRTPLSTIRATLETLLRLDPGIERDAAQRFLEMMERQVRRLEALVCDMLNLSRVESGTVEFQTSRIELPAIFAELHERFAEPLTQKGLQWEVDCPTETYRLVASTYLLELILDNLVDNAIKFTDRGGTIRLSSRLQPNQIEICVADTGCGVSVDDESRVFERFYQVDRSRSGADRGTGLGLSIVRHAVTAMGGSVRLKSRLGAGTSVFISVPISGRPTAGVDSKRVVRHVNGAAA